MFESILSDMLLAKPEDPHQFVSGRLSEFPMELREELARRVLQLKSASEPISSIRSNPLRPADIPVAIGVHDTLILQLVSADCKRAAFAALTELRTDAMNTGKCVSFQVFFDEANLEILVEQSWETSDALAEFLKSQAFQRFQPKWTGLLLSPPTSKQYTRKIL